MSSRSPMLLVLLGVVLLFSSASAEIPTVISYQGRVTDSGGTPVADGDYSMTFSVYDASSGGSSLWSSGTVTVTVSGGVFSVLLGESPQPAITLAFDADYWVEVDIAGDVQSPRATLGSVGYAYMASGVVPGTVVSGSIAGGTQSALRAMNTSTATYTVGLWGEAIAEVGRGVLGRATATAGEAYGVLGRSFSTQGAGVYGSADATTGTTYGILGISASTAGRGVFGSATASSGYPFGVYGEAVSSLGRGVVGHATATTGACIGVLGRSYSPSGMGVYGAAMATTGTNYAIYGETSSATGYAGYFEGDVQVTEDLTVLGALNASGIGDITAVNAGAGLSGGGTSGSVTLSAAVPLSLTGSTSNAIIQGTNTNTTGSSPGLRGETSSTMGFGIWGNAFATSGATTGGRFEASSTSGMGVYAVASATAGTTYGVYATSSSTAGRGLYGLATATTGTTYGVYGESQSSAGYGLYGWASSAGGSTNGVYGRANSSNGTGVYGYASAGSGTTYGVQAVSGSNAGYGLYANGATGGAGVSPATNGKGLHGSAFGTGSTYGVLGEATSSQGRGVCGTVSSTTGTTYGVYGSSDSESGAGVYGYATWSSGTNYGVRGRTESASGYGVYGQAAASNANYGLYSYGNTGATGTKSAIVKTSDHGWRHLYSVESPEVLFEDVGTGHLAGGVGKVAIDPVFAQTVNLEAGYHVFIQVYGDASVYVTDRTPSTFTVRVREGRPDVDFSYRIIAKRAGFEDLRLTAAADPSLMPRAGAEPPNSP